MDTKETLYIKILVWAYNKQEEGFSWPELLSEFNLNNEQERYIAPNITYFAKLPIHHIA